MPIFKNIFVSPNIADIFEFFAKHKNAYILKTVLHRADCADFGCHHSIRLETKHFLNTLALTFISFSGCFVFAMQKHYLFFCERSSSFIFLYFQPSAISQSEFFIDLTNNKYLLSVVAIYLLSCQLSPVYFPSNTSSHIDQLESRLHLPLVSSV